MEKHVNKLAWSLSFTVVLVALVAWGSFVKWQFNSNYRLFPLFGLLAFSVMWAHYMVAALRWHLGLDKDVLAKYFRLTSMGVLFFLLLHPGLLIWQLWRDGLGLPPKSYLENYVGPALEWAAILGTISLFIFLLFELHRIYGEKKWWRFIQYGSDLAMLMIFFHALRLGSLMSGWFRYVWYFYGLSYLIGLLYTYIRKAKLIKEGTI